MAWVHLYLLGTLGLWVLTATAVTGWTPVVLTTGSMSPMLRPGDVVLLEQSDDEPVVQGSVITFRRPGADQPVTHRVFEVLEDGRFVTKGDANPTPDTDRVDRSQVQGVGRLVIPSVGLPVVWSRTGNTLPVVAFAVLTMVALAVVGSSLAVSDRSASPSRSATPLVERAVRRVRMLSVLLVLSQFVFDRQHFVGEALGLPDTGVLLIVLLVLSATNVISTRSGSSMTGNGRMAVTRRGLPVWVELAADTGVVVMLTALTGGAGIGWVMMALPIVEAAVRFRLSGALTHWLVMGMLTMLARLWILERTEAGVDEFMGQLDQLLDQFGVLLLVAIPGAYLAEQLAGDVTQQTEATDRATERSRNLEQVAEAGRHLNRLGAGDTGRIGTQLFELLTSAAVGLGFDVADLWIRREGRSWLLAADATATPNRVGALPQPGAMGSGLRDDDLVMPEVVVDALDPDPAEPAALIEGGAARLVRITLADLDGTLIAVRTADADPDRRAGDVEALRLLCAQATVALQNNKLLTDLQSMHDELEHQATHDALTGLPNRSWFMTRLRQRLAAPDGPRRARRGHVPRPERVQAGQRHHGPRSR